MQITLNGKTHTLADTTSVEALIEQLSLDVRKIAVEQNAAIVSPSQFSNTQLNEGDQVEIVSFIGGG